MKGKFYCYMTDENGVSEFSEFASLQDAKNLARTAIEAGAKKVLILRCVTVATAKASASFGDGQ